MAETTCCDSNIGVDLCPAISSNVERTFDLDEGTSHRVGVTVIQRSADTRCAVIER